MFERAMFLGAAALAVVMIGCGRAPEATSPVPAAAKEAPPNTEAKEVKEAEPPPAKPEMFTLPWTEVARIAVRGNQDEREEATSLLRGRGQLGLQAFEAAWRSDIHCLREYGTLHEREAMAIQRALNSQAKEVLWEHGSLSPEAVQREVSHRERLEAAYAKISGQYDGLYSGIYWHSDLGSAQNAARESSKPILSLRVLGSLDDAMC